VCPKTPHKLKKYDMFTIFNLKYPQDRVCGGRGRLKIFTDLLFLRSLGFGVHSTLYNLETHFFES